MQKDNQFALRVPNNFKFTEQGAPLLAVEVSKDTPDPQDGPDMVVAVSVDSGNKLHLHPTAEKPSPNSLQIAWADYKNTVSKNGWGYLSIKATDDAKVSDDLKMYVAGFLEGYTSARQIRDFQHNANALKDKDESKHHADENIRNLFVKELGTIHKQSGMTGNSSVLSSANEPKDNFWQHAKLLMFQAWGILDAYNQHATSVKGTALSMIDLLILNADGETPELEMAYDMEEFLLRQSEHEGGDADSENATGDGEVFLQKRVGSHHRFSRGHVLSAGEDRIRRAKTRRLATMRNLDDKAWRRIKMSTGRCSALVRLAKENKDLFVGHTTFSDYSEMNRIFKYYDFPLGGSASRKMGFSSYPGVAGSTDDYYLMDTGLVVTETTISMLSDEPYDKLDDNGTFIPDYMRIMIANRLAKTGKDWVDVMERSATGTYSSQWMVVDYKLFKPGQALQNGTFWVLEQVPGMQHAQDMSEKLQSRSFWASENRAWFKDIRDMVGETEAEELHGNLFSANKNPRAHIFTATESKVNTLADMRAEMERNKWPHEVDGGPMNTPDHAIAARGDLDRKDPQPNGAVDSKVTNFCLAKKLSADTINGPTHDGQKPFKWTNSAGKSLYPDYPHDGLPDLWNFDWIRMTPDGEMKMPNDECSTN